MTPARPEAPARWRLGVLSLAVATACAVPDYGAQYRTLPEVSDACLLELDGPADIGAEFSWSLFDCVYRRSGYFDEMESLAWYATHDDEAVACFPRRSRRRPTRRWSLRHGGGGGRRPDVDAELRHRSDPLPHRSRRPGRADVRDAPDDYSLMILAGSTVAAMAEQAATCESTWDPSDPSSERCPSSV